MKRLSVGLFLLAAASGSLSAQVTVTPPLFGTVRSGETARIEWKQLPRGVEELELLLTMEGQELSVRVTPQLVAGASVYLWRVPNLRSRHARLTIRYGLDGEEIKGAASEPFEILPADNEPPAALAFRQGEWWIQESSQDHFPGALTTRDEGDRLQENREGPPCAASAQTIPTASRTCARAAGSNGPRERSSEHRLILARKPTEVPARI